ncbi:SH3 domain-containing protein [Flavobacterium notoginsengisoli]|uniref:SH3 domain-containing protein n=1 Tax=Flavobacterium notoginsengisoli TaxID=1478199 RepID=UPI003635AA2D
MMKKLFYYTLLFLTVTVATSAQTNKLVASCCETKKEMAGRCTGSAYCSACSNCSRCAHCSSGGSCGVCASYSPPVRYSPPRVTTPSSKSKKSSQSKRTEVVSFTSEASVKAKTKKEAVVKKAAVIYHPEDMVAVGSETLKLREEPGTEAAVIETLERYDLLMVIAVDGEWLQVKVIQSGNYGYVKAEYVYKM